MFDLFACYNFSSEMATSLLGLLFVMGLFGSRTQEPGLVLHIKTYQTCAPKILPHSLPPTTPSSLFIIYGYKGKKRVAGRHNPEYLIF